MMVPSGAMRKRSGKKILLLTPTPTPTTSSEEPRRSPECPNADWSSLPDELLDLILQRLQLADYVRFGAVCRRWNRVVAEKPHPPAQARKPWIWVPEKGACGLYCLSERRWYRHRHLPSFLTECDCCGSQHGWLIFTPSLRISYPYSPLLLNPLSCAQIRLSEIPASCFDKFYCSLPPDDPRCIVVCVQRSGRMSVCSPGSNWVSCQGPGCRISIMSAIFYKGLLYVATFNGELCLVDLASRKPDGRPIIRIVLAPPIEGMRQHSRSPMLLLEHHGDLLMVYLRSDNYKVFKANLELLIWEAAKILGSQPLITSDYWPDFMPLSKKQCKSPTECFVEIGSKRRLLYCNQFYCEVMFSPRL